MEVTGPYQRSLVPAAAGDNTPQIIGSQGQLVVPAAVARHPITEVIKKVTGLPRVIGVTGVPLVTGRNEGLDQREH